MNEMHLNENTKISHGKSADRPPHIFSSMQLVLFRMVYGFHFSVLFVRQNELLAIVGWIAVKSVRNG